MDASDKGTIIQQGNTIINIENLGTGNFGLPDDNKTFNEFLTKELLTAIKPYSEIAAMYVEAYKKIPDWNRVDKHSNKAKEIIASSYVGIIGTQLVKLMAIGKEDISPNSKKEKYVTYSLSTANRTIQLLCFTMLSDLWNRKKNNDFVLAPSHTENLKAFFNVRLDWSLKDYLGLLSDLHFIYTANNLPFPLPELADFSVQLRPGSVFLAACDQLDAMSNLPDNTRYTSKNCEDAEIQLTTLLSSLAFLASYQMVSIKDIGYEEVRNTAPRYLHNYVALGADRGNTDNLKLRYREDPVSTDSILLYKGDYRQSINLFPFIIDYNALTFENKVKICFFSKVEMELKNTINFCFLEDDSDQNVTYSGAMKEGINLDNLNADEEDRKKYKLDSVYLQFMEAKKIILGIND